VVFVEVQREFSSFVRIEGPGAQDLVEVFHFFPECRFFLALPKGAAYHLVTLGYAK